jgi:hypothetical protein
MATTPISFWKTPIALGCIGVIAVAGAVVALNVATGASEKENALPAELTVASLTKASQDGDRREVFRNIMDRDDLTDEQRREAFRNMRDVGRRQMDARMNEYFNATSQDEKNAVLDAQIDEFAKMREQWQQRREQREADGENNRERMQQLFQPPSQQERKARSENRNPDETARRMAYMSAMRSRMTERGISMGGGPRGGGGFRP